MQISKDDGKDLVSLGSAMVFIIVEAAYFRDYSPKLHAIKYFLCLQNFTEL